MAGPVYQFGDFRLDCGRFELTRNGHLIPVERKPMELLILLAEHRGELVTRTQIAERLWEREVFVDTEHGINTAIGKIRYTLRDNAEDPRFVQTVTGKGYRFVAPIAVPGREDDGMPGAAEITVNGTAAAAAAQPASPSSEAMPPEKTEMRLRRRWLTWALPAVLLVAAMVGLTARSWTRRHRAAEPNIRSLAVLPLENLSGDPGQEYFADGMTDELTTMLAKDSTLRVVSRTSTLQYKGAHRPLPEIARALGVDAILEGSVERSGNHVHMTLQLIRGDDDSHIWAESYDRDANDVALPDEAAQVIAKRLNCFVPAAAARYVNPAAHDAFLQGKYLWFSGRYEEAKQYFLKATELQPDYASGWAGLANYYGAAVVSWVLDPRGNLDLGEQAAVRALQLDPTLPEAHLAMGAAYFFHRWDFAAADRELLAAIALDPRFAEAYHVRAKLLGVLNRHAEAIESEKKAMEIDPFERPWALALAYMVARQYDAALDDVQLRLKTNPRDPDSLWLMMDIYRRKGMHAEQVEAWAKWHEATGDPKSAANLRRAYQQGGFPTFVRWEIARRTEQAKKEYVPPLELACYHAQLREREETLSWLEEGYRQHSPDVLWTQTDPAYDFLHDDPRYRALVQKMGLPPTY
jgi:TolB-like protein/DNA-binding winged helix-turn-helix (wHTH) protein/Tfp pilus assembly protein PilF